MPEIEKDLRVESADGDVKFVRKHFGTPEFYVFNDEGEQYGWGKKEDAFMMWLTSIDSATIEPVDHTETPMGPK